jgi:antirestriction protein ArdC
LEVESWLKVLKNHPRAIVPAASKHQTAAGVEVEDDLEQVSDDDGTARTHPAVAWRNGRGQLGRRSLLGARN